MIITTGLDYLRTKTKVDCDTFDEQGIHYPSGHPVLPS